MADHSEPFAPEGWIIAPTGSWWWRRWTARHPAGWTLTGLRTRADAVLFAASWTALAKAAAARPPIVEQATRFDLNTGDTIALRIDRHLSGTEWDALSAHFHDSLPGMRVMFLEGGLRLEGVIAAEQTP